ncbi:protein of unknown function [Enterobacter cancerogenus]|nr:protein of unknown function [Enterobacter cancerogenus]
MNVIHHVFLKTWHTLFTTKRPVTKNNNNVLYSSIKKHKPQFRVAYVLYDTHKAKQIPSVCLSKKI